MGAWQHRRSDRGGRPPMRSPGRPSVGSVGNCHAAMAKSLLTTLECELIDRVTMRNLNLAMREMFHERAKSSVAVALYRVGASLHPRQPLRHSQRGSLPGMGEEVHPFSWQSSSPEAGRAGGGGVPHSPRRDPGRRAGHPGTGVERAAAPVSARATAADRDRAAARRRIPPGCSSGNSSFRSRHVPDCGPVRCGGGCVRPR